MKILFSYEQRIIIVKQKNEENILKKNIFSVSLGKIKNCLQFIKDEEEKNKNKYENIKDYNSKIFISENINKIKIKYKINQNNDKYNSKKKIDKIQDIIVDKIKYKNIVNVNKIKIFGEAFVKNNKNNCYIVNNGVKYNLNTYFYIKERKEKNNKIKKLKIELVGIMKVTNLEDLFNGCSLLESLPDISKWNINNVTNISSLFRNCSSLKSLPDY